MRERDDRDRDRQREDRDRERQRDDRDRDRQRNYRDRDRDTERRDSFAEKREPKRWKQGGRVLQIYAGDGIGDSKIERVKDDPRMDAPITVGGKGANTESWDPESTLVRPEMRVVVGSKTRTFNKTLKHDDVVIVPEFFCAEDDWGMYYKLVEEMRAVQKDGQKNSEWIPWAEGSHLISKNPKGCPTYEKVVARTAEYFKIKPGSEATRFNWYRDSSDWKVGGV